MIPFIRSLLRSKIEIDPMEQHYQKGTVIRPVDYRDFKNQCQAIPGAVGYYTIDRDQKISYTVKVIG